MRQCYIVEILTYHNRISESRYQNRANTHLHRRDLVRAFSIMLNQAHPRLEQRLHSKTLNNSSNNPSTFIRQSL